MFHTLSLTPIPEQVPLLLWSFLATQCCDAVLYVWLPPEIFRAFDASSPPIAVPAHHAHRIRYMAYDAPAEWAKVAGDFPAHNQSAMDAMTSHADLRFHSDWARMVLMYVYGGTWVDLDTLFLRDFRPVLPFAPFMYRAGALILPNNAVFRLGKRPNAMSQRIIDSVFVGRHPGPIPVFYNLGVEMMGTPSGLLYLSEALFGFSCEWSVSRAPHPSCSARLAARLPRHTARSLQGSASRNRRLSP